MAIGKKTIVIEVDYKELEKLIEETYGHEFDVVADQEWGNDGQHSVLLKKNGELSTYDLSKVNRFRKDGGGAFALYSLMRDMANNGVLEDGYYLITICW